jgi:DDE superfamily endonuclease
MSWNQGNYIIKSEEVKVKGKVRRKVVIGLIIAANINAPGSWHDSRVAQPIYEKLHTKTPDGFYLVANTAFPRGNREIEDRIQAPLKTGQQICGTRAQIEEKMLYNRELLSYRQTAEWGNRALQGAFGCLCIPLEINHSSRCQQLIEICICLHNLHTNRVGLNEIRNVYMKVWIDDGEIWSHFEDMLFFGTKSKR